MEWNPHKTGNNNSGKIKSIYARGADDGFLMGLYFTVLFALTVVALNVPAVNVAAAVMSLGVPFLTYRFLRRTHAAAHGMASFSTLWMQGITMFACGSLIFGAASFIYLRWIEPGFIARVLQTGIEFYRSSPSESAQLLADEFQMIIDSKVMPSALNIAFGWMWLGMFSGSILSMIVAGIVRIKKV